MTSADAERPMPVIASWATAVKDGDIARAAGYFDLPAIIHHAGGARLEARTPAIVEAFNASLPCAAKLLAANPQGRYVVGTFVLGNPGTQPCRAKGQLARVGFVFGDSRYPDRFTEWWEMPSKPGSRIGPSARPQSATPATVADFG